MEVNNVNYISTDSVTPRRTPEESLRTRNGHEQIDFSTSRTAVDTEVGGIPTNKISPITLEGKELARRKVKSIIITAHHCEIRFVRCTCERERANGAVKREKKRKNNVDIISIQTTSIFINSSLHGQTTGVCKLLDELYVCICLSDRRL